MRKLIFSLLCMAFFLSLPAQNIGDISYRRIYSNSGGSVDEISRSISGALCAGKAIKYYPDGTIFECKYLGNGYYSTKAYDLDCEGIVSGTENIDAKYADPRKGLNTSFMYDRYATSSPALGDKPVARYYIEYANNTNEPEKYGDAVINFYTILNPGTENQKATTYRYYGRFLPYCVSINYEQTNNGVKSIPEERLYNWVNVIGEMKGLYYRGLPFNAPQQ